MLKWLILPCIIVLSFNPKLGKASAGDNKIEFKILCEIIHELQRVASTGGETPLEETTKELLQRIRANVSVAHNLIRGEQGSDHTKESAGNEKTSGPQKWEPINPHTPFGKYKVSLAEKRVSQIEKDLDPKSSIACQIGELASAMQTASGKARREATLAICGAGQTATFGECTQEGFGNNVAAGMLTAAGMSLANDVAYLCGGSSGKDECLDVAASATQVSAKANGPAMFNELRGKCPPETKRSGHPDREHLQSALSIFFRQLGTRVKIYDGSQSAATIFPVKILGKLEQAGATTNCAAATPCISYGARTQAGTEGIPWVGHVREVLKEWRTVERGEVNMSRLVERMEKLQTEAWALYLQAKEEENISFNEGTLNVSGASNQKQTPHTSTDKATTQEPYTMNAAFIQRLILPWTLLI